MQGREIDYKDCATIVISVPGEAILEWLIRGGEAACHAILPAIFKIRKHRARMTRHREQL